MHPRNLLPLACLALAGLAAAAAQPAAFAGPSAADYRPQDYKVYVDKPTGFAYIKTPYGWKFIRHLDPRQVAKLPKDVTTPPKPVTQSDSARRG